MILGIRQHSRLEGCSVLNIGCSTKIVHSQYNAESVPTHDTSDRQTGSTCSQPHMTFLSVLPSPLSSSSSWSPRPRRSRTRHLEKTASAGECIITKSSHAAKILRHLSHMMWLSVGFRLRPTGCQPLGPPIWASLFVRGILLLPAPSLGPPYVRNACAMQRPVSSAISKSHKRPLFKIPILRLSTTLTRKSGKDYAGTSPQACGRPWLPTRGSGPTNCH